MRTLLVLPVLIPLVSAAASRVAWRSERMQRALRFEGNDVRTIFKNLQLDIGMAHQFMDCG